MSEPQDERAGQRYAEQVKFACLRVGDGFYALDIMCIREIIRPLPITPIPKAPLFIDGIINLRKAVIPIVDLRRRFDLPVADQGSLQRMVICAVAGRMVGLVVDEVTEVRSCLRDDIQPAPFYLSGDSTRFFPGVCRSGEQTLMLIDLKKILSSDQRIDGQTLSRQVEAHGRGSEITYDY
ncbi:MAG: chemotaxis protein CheW [Desulfuromonadales bacterium]|nr:chemotaxis protein CheW [Desulfuromonadales bacterium]